MADDVKAVDEKEDRLGGPTFSPPLYCQRYMRVAAIIEDRAVKSVVDFGCAECNFMRYLRNIRGLHEVAGVDILRATLESHKYLITPLPMEYLQRRLHRLRFRLYEGSICEYDARLQGFEAVTMIEVIEHLEPDVLERFPTVLFGQLRPKVVVMTTPNEEFNILFPGFTGMRHWDHKFEWKRHQFQEWCSRVAEQYGYSVEYDGMGDPPAERSDVGHCSQMALFLRKTSEEAGDVMASDEGGDTPYKQVAESVFPYREKQTQEEELLEEVEYYIRMVSSAMYRNRHSDGEDSETGDITGPSHDEQEMNKEGEREEVADYDSSQVLVPLKKIMSFKKVENLCSDPGILRLLLEKSGYRFSHSGRSIVVPMEDSDSEFEPEDWDEAIVVEEGGMRGTGQFSDAEFEEKDASKKGGIFHWNDLDVKGSRFPCRKINYVVVPGQFDDAE